MKAKPTGAWIVVALGVVLALVFSFSRSAPVEAVYPVEKAKVSFVRRVWSRVVGVFRGAEASAENVRLRTELGRLSATRGELERIEAENARLRGVLAYARRNAVEMLPAAVLTAEGGAVGARRTLRVDKGSLDGVREDATVVAPVGLVGRVTSVTPHTAEVTLVTDPSVKVACTVETKTGRPPFAVLSGGSDERLVLRWTRRTEEIPEGARVVTSGLGGMVPKGIAVGTFLSGNEVQPFVDFDGLEDVFIRREK